jgi:iron complex outermembrane receptor protein
MAGTVRGVVKDAAGQPLAHATVFVSPGGSTESRADGTFVLPVPEGTKVALRIEHDGFQPVMRDAADGDSLEVTLRQALAETIVVSGIRAEAAVPVTKTDVGRGEIERRYHQQDIPLLLRDVPSVNSYTESGVGGAGYSYISLRGVSPSRINFTLDGVPLADSEDMGTYFADFPDLAHSLQSIQVQRGVGTSTVGTPSFGGSVNMESIDLSSTKSLDTRIATGSYGSRFATLGYQSGSLPGGLALYSRISVNQSDGYREHSGVRQHNLFLSVARQGEDSQLRLTGFTGHERQQMSFLATDIDTLRIDPRHNDLDPNERDSFGYDLANLQYLRTLSPTTSLTASGYYQRGYGSYQLYDDNTTHTNLRDYGLDGQLLGALVTLGWSRGPLTASYGLHVNRFRRDHTRDLVGGPRDYANYGVKGEGNAFAKLNFDRGAWHLYGDAQLRRSTFRYHGDVAVAPIDWTFFNPQAGARYALTPSSSVYASVGMTTREPTRNDLFQGEDNATVPHDLHAVHPERLLDLEGGWSYSTSRVAVVADVYAMELRHEIAATGEQSDIGLPLRRNVDRSYRRGIELDATWQPSASLRLRGVANVSRNRIRTWTQFYDVYDDAGNYAGSKPLDFRNVNPLLTPTTLLSASVDYAPIATMTLGAIARHTGRSYLDNTNSAAFTTPSFTTIDATASLSLGRWIAAGTPRLTLQVNNLTDNHHVWPNGYSYQFITRQPTGSESIGGTPYYYPQAGRNAVLMLDVKL